MHAKDLQESDSGTGEAALRAASRNSGGRGGRRREAVAGRPWEADEDETRAEVLGGRALAGGGSARRWQTSLKAPDTKSLIQTD